MSTSASEQRHVRHILLGAFLGVAGLFFSVAATVQSNDVGIMSADIVEASADESMLNAETVSAAISRRKELLEQTLTVIFSDDVGPITESVIKMEEHPSWVVFRMDRGDDMAVIDMQRVKQHVISYPPENLPLPQTCSITRHYTDDYGVERVETDCIAKSGFFYDVDAVTDAVFRGLSQKSGSVSVTLQKVPGQLLDPERSPDRPLTLLSTGRSNFKGSDGGRKSNVRKAINEREHNVFIPQDTDFEFNDTLGIVSLSRGWFNALTIFEGVNLRPAPGGGICQASTTVFRAAVNAGLPIITQKNHSLYVKYYEAYGVGLDATVFPGKQDLVFKNDTGGPIVMQSYTEGDEVYVNMYGYDDGRSVALSGPYFWDDQNVLQDGKKIKTNEIVWVRTVTKDGQSTDHVVTARYNAIPKKLHDTWDASTVMTRTGAQEPLEVASN